MTFNDQVMIDTHRIKVTKFTDWTYKLSKYHWVEDVVKNIDFNTVTDEINIPCGKEPKIVWEADHHFNIGLPATITVLFESGCGGEMSIRINGNVKYNFKEGDCRTFQVDHLKTIEVSCNAGDGVCKGIVEIEFNPEVFVEWLNNADVECNFTNDKGKPQPGCSSIRCMEILQNEERDSIQLTLPDWNSIELQRVKLLKKGYVVLTFYVNDNCVFTTKPFLFEAVEKVLLTAPEDTKIQCEILECDCQVVGTKITDSKGTLEVNLTITMYQRIMAVEKVVVEVEGTYCFPRKDT